MNVNGRNGAARQCLATPRWIKPHLEARYGTLMLDVCAQPSTAMCKQFYRPSDNGLEKKWKRDYLNWCNPPFGNVASWLNKAAAEMLRGCRVLLLLPVRVECDWWRTYQHYAEITVLVPRLRYMDPETGLLVPGSPNFASCLWYLTKTSARSPGDCRFRYLRLTKPPNAVR